MIAALLIAALTAPSPVESAHFDRLDINHVYCEDGSVRFTQLVFWRWSRIDRRFYSFGFKIVKDEKPMVRKTAHGYVAEWSKNGRRVRVTADSFIEWHSSYDPEMLDRRCFPDVVREW